MDLEGWRAPWRELRALGVHRSAPSLPPRTAVAGPEAWARTADALTARLAWEASRATSTVCVDFDGTLTRPEPYRPGQATAPPRPGVVRAMAELRDQGYRLVVLTARPCSEVYGWLADHGLSPLVAEVTNTKPPAIAYIDDRGVAFDGSWAKALERVRQLRDQPHRPQVGNDAELQAEFDESQHPRDEAGRFAEFEQAIAKPAKGTGLRLERVPAEQRAWRPGDPPAKLRTFLSKQQTGALGQRIAVQYLRDHGMPDARELPLTPGLKALDVFGDHQLIEVKAGLADNEPDARKWRSTQGEARGKELALQQRLSPKALAAHNARKQREVYARKDTLVERISAALGQQVHVGMITMVVDPDRRVADIYHFPAIEHGTLRWAHADVQAAYIGSVRYKEHDLSAYSDDQPRDEQGRWTDGGGGLALRKGGEAVPERPHAGLTPDAETRRAVREELVRATGGDKQDAARLERKLTRTVAGEVLLAALPRLHAIGDENLAGTGMDGQYFTRGEKVPGRYGDLARGPVILRAYNVSDDVFIHEFGHFLDDHAIATIKQRTPDQADTHPALRTFDAVRTQMLNRGALREYQKELARFSEVVSRRGGGFGKVFPEDHPGTPTKAVSHYALTSFAEWKAEAFRVYAKNPDKLQRSSPATFRLWDAVARGRTVKK